MKSKSSWERPNKRNRNGRGPRTDKQILNSVQPEACKEARAVEAMQYGPRALNKLIDAAARVAM